MDIAGGSSRGESTPEVEICLQCPKSTADQSGIFWESFIEEYNKALKMMLLSCYIAAFFIISNTLTLVNEYYGHH